MLNLTHRPTKFSELIGNEVIIKKLLEQYPDWPKSFLLIGPAGVGKTTLARCIANQLECKKVNYHEIDAGQDRGIDNIRKIIGAAMTRPLVGKTKVYVFDECQGLTKDAQQALLKITEEPPSNTYFVFCSTDPQKIIKPLKERCQFGLLALQPMSDKELGILLKKICALEEIEVDEKVSEIGRLCIADAQGIPRRAVMNFNKLYNYDDIDEVKKVLENTDDDVPEDFWKYPNALDANMTEFIKLFSKRTEKNYESFRIIMGHIFKKKAIRAMQNGNESDITKYNNILAMFDKPVDNQLGDIELISRFTSYYLKQC